MINVRKYQSALPRIFVKLRVHSCAPEYGRGLGVVLSVAQNKKFFSNMAK